MATLASGVAWFSITTTRRPLPSTVCVTCGAEPPNGAAEPLAPRSSAASATVVRSRVTG